MQSKILYLSLLPSLALLGCQDDPTTTTELGLNQAALSVVTASEVHLNLPLPVREPQLNVDWHEATITLNGHDGTLLEQFQFVLSAEDIDGTLQVSLPATYALIPTTLHVTLRDRTGHIYEYDILSSMELHNPQGEHAK